MVPTPAINIAVLLIVLPFLLFSQDRSKTDSLTSFLKQHTSRDSAYVDALNELAFEQRLGDPKKLELAYQARSLAKELNYQKGLAYAYRQVGLVAWSQANYPLALSQLIEGLKIAEAMKDAQIIADIYGNLGLVYQGLGDYTQALDFQLKSLALQRKLKNQFRETVALNNLGDIKRSLKEYAEAVAYYSQAMVLSEANDNLNGQATSIRNIGNIYEDEKKFTLALEHYFRSLKLSDGRNEKRGMCLSRLSIASTYLKMKDYSLAKKYALESLTIAKQAETRALIRDAYLILSQITEIQKNTNEAFKYYKLYSLYQDSVVNVSIGSEIATYRLEYETQKQQAEIDLLTKDAQLQESVISRKNTLLTSTILTLGLAVLLLVILLRNFARQKSINRLLKVKNEEIEKQRTEITEQRDKLISLNEEISAHQEAIIANRDALAEKNASIAEMNHKILEINENLEKTIAERTYALERQNQQLIEYSFINAHKLRAPLARILGLVNLVKLTTDGEEQKKLMDFLMQTSMELDEVVKSINTVVQEGLEAYKREP